MAENFFGITDTGRQRTNNEDAFIAQRIWDNGYILACVIDGVGGYEGGEVAAQLCKETVEQYFSIPSGSVNTMLQEALVAANEKIRTEKGRNSQLESMACVVTLAVVDEDKNRFHYAHIGDTRLYLYRDGAMVKITKDHSFVGFLEDNGRISEEAAMAHPKRNEIDKALGFDAPVNNGAIETGESPFLPGDALLLCSDGLSDMLTLGEITALYQNGKTLADKGKALVDAANKKGGKDNITVVLVQNRSKPLKQKRVKPVVVKKNSRQQPEAAAPQPKEEVKAVTTKSYKGAAIGLGILSLMLAAAVGYLLWSIEKEEKTAKAKPDVFVESEAERKLIDSLQNLQGNHLVLTEAAFQNPILLTDTLLITKDSLRLSGMGNIVLQSAAGYSGAAIELSKEISDVFIDSLTIKNFKVGILAGSARLHLKGVRFVNCSLPVQYALQFTDSMAISGTIQNGRFIQSDSSQKSLRK
ncbi:MAG: PP2C family protein-serine/threonine phosphatase [Chitinophagaceae bacterium]